MIDFANASRILLVQEKSNPSTDYYLLPRIQASGKTYRVLTDHALPPSDELNGACLVFVRYIPRGWETLVKRHRQHIARIIYFMDDDLLDVSATRNMRLRYRWRLVKLATRYQGFLKKMGAEIWVSSHFLQQKYVAWQPRQIDPLPVVTTPALKEKITVFYHGSPVTHQQEIEWLFPVMQRVLEKNAAIHFEAIGDAAINRLLKQLPRTSILHSMSWENYQAYCDLQKRDIGLAPLLPSPFNAARSHIKFFDITRCGAAGLYSRASPFSDFVRDEEDGLLLENNPEHWVAAILRLAEHREPREYLYKNAVQRMEQLPHHPIISAPHYVQSPEG